MTYTTSCVQRLDASCSKAVSEVLLVHETLRRLAREDARLRYLDDVPIGSAARDESMAARPTLLMLPDDVLKDLILYNQASHSLSHIYTSVLQCNPEPFGPRSPCF